MNEYVTGATIKRLREEKGMTQAQLADKIFVTAKAVSKWETGHGLPDISLLEPLGKALGISIIELLNGQHIQNKNRGFNMQRLCFYVCPVCANIVQSTGEATISCCGITLPPLQAEDEDENEDEGHKICLEKTEDEYYVSSNHPMTKEHYLSFFAAVSDSGIQFAKLYPESDAQARFKVDGIKWIYAYCNHHGLFRVKAKII